MVSSVGIMLKNTTGTDSSLHLSIREFVLSVSGAQIATASVPLVRAASSLLVPQMLGYHRAAEALLLGEPFMAEAALEAGLVAAGVDVQLLGPMPTPAVAFLTRTLGADAGIVISASHNPHHDNGIKFFSAQGEKLDDATELAIDIIIDASIDASCQRYSKGADEYRNHS